VELKRFAATVVSPPDLAPLAGCKDSSRVGQVVPLVAQDLERVHPLDPRYNFGLSGRSLSSVSAHVPLSRRVLRVVARTIGVPVGLAAVLILRLSNRKAGVALMYHSVEERAGDPVRELVPPHGAPLFERQIRYVSRTYEVVQAARLLEAVRARRRGQRFPLAITFDDDLACHATVALPILSRIGVTATFFLSGASLDRPFAFHYERLQRAFDQELPRVAALVTGNPDATEPSRIHDLGLMLEMMPPPERDAAAARLGRAVGPDPPNVGIRAPQVRQLADAGMTIGFHTYRHDSLTRLTDDELARAMETGRDALAEAAGNEIDTIGYPHGRADKRVAAAARAAGFRAGFTTRHDPITPRSDPLLLGRVGPSRRSAGALALELAFTLLKSENARSSPVPPPEPS
jgi:peptidoglycan/xylan/chitin deacetylase (PgdA/CDA1 family)